MEESAEDCENIFEQSDPIKESEEDKNVNIISKDVQDDKIESIFTSPKSDIVLKPKNTNIPKTEICESPLLASPDNSTTSDETNINNKTSKQVIQACVLENRSEMHDLFMEGNQFLQKFKHGLQQYKKKTFFRPDALFLKGTIAAYNQVELGINKMGLLFSSQSSDTSEKRSSGGVVSVMNEKRSSGGVVSVMNIDTPPASEAGSTTNDTSTLNDDMSSTVRTSLDSSSTTSDVVSDVATAERRKSVRHSAKRKRKSDESVNRKLSSSISAVVDSVIPASKRPRRSLLSQFLTKKAPEEDEPKKEEEKEDDEEDSDTDKDEERGEFEVEKILDYNKVKGKCVYQVRWRNYGPKDDTWEPLENLTGCELILHSFIRTRLVQRSRVKTSEDLKDLLLPCEERLRPVLRTAFMAQLSAPQQPEVEAALPLLVTGKIKVKEMNELDEDIDKLVAIKDCISEKYTKQYSDFKQQLVLRECRQQRERQKAELRCWEREMSRICSDPAPLSVVNDVDYTLPPKDFVYINEYIAGRGIKIPQDPIVGCVCTDCANSNKTCCPNEASSFFAYNKYGRLKVSIGTAIYECNKLCACFKTNTCLNRVVQRGRTIQLTIFRTPNGRGWGVKAGEAIKAGAFVTEYVGEVISSDEAERRGQIYDARGCTYLFDLDYDKGDNNLYTVDAAKYGNVSHFINHSCDPNLMVFNVWVNCLDPDLPKLALFAARDIKKGEEITFDYNSPSARTSTPVVEPEVVEGESSILQADSPTRLQSEGSMDMSVRKTPKRGIVNGQTACHCGAANCRKFFF